MLERVGHSLGHRDELTAVGRRAAVEVVSDLAARLHDCAEVLLVLELAADDEAHRHSHRYRAVSVAELTVVVELEARAHRVVAYREGADYRIGGLNLLAKEAVEAVLVDARTVGGAVKAADAAAVETDFREVDDARRVGIDGLEVAHHRLDRLGSIAALHDDDRLAARLLLGLGQRRKVILHLRRRLDRRLFDNSLLRAVEDVLHKLTCVALTRLLREVVHIGGETLDVAKPEVCAVVRDKAVCGDVVEVLRG